MKADTDMSNTDSYDLWLEEQSFVHKTFFASDAKLCLLDKFEHHQDSDIPINVSE